MFYFSDAWTIVSTLVQRIRKTKHQSVLHGLAMWTLGKPNMRIYILNFMSV